MKARLTSDHYMYGRLLPAGTVIGNDTPYPLTAAQLSIEMEPLDDEAQGHVDDHHEEVRRRSDPNFNPGTGELSLSGNFPVISRKRPDGTFGPPAIFGNEARGDVDQVPEGVEKPIKTGQPAKKPGDK